MTFMTFLTELVVGVVATRTIGNSTIYGIICPTIGTSCAIYNAATSDRSKNLTRFLICRNDLKMDIYRKGELNESLHKRSNYKQSELRKTVQTGGADEDVMEALSDKGATQDRLLQAIKARIDKYREVPG